MSLSRGRRDAASDGDDRAGRALVRLRAAVELELDPRLDRLEEAAGGALGRARVIEEGRREAHDSCDDSRRRECPSLIDTGPSPSQGASRSRCLACSSMARCDSCKRVSDVR